MADRGQMSIIFPTRRNLERLAQADDFVAFSAHAAVYPIDLVTPWIETRRGAAHLCIRSEEHTSELQSLMRISYAVFCLKKKKNTQKRTQSTRKHTYITK